MQATRKDVVIVGGGLSGLTAAWLLAPTMNVTLLEAETTPGGQARAFKIDGVTVEHGSHAFFGYYRTSVDLLRALGTLDDTIRIPGWSIVDAYGRVALIRQSPSWPRRIAAVPSILRVPWFKLRDKVGALVASNRLIGYDYDDYDELDQYTAEQLAAKLGYTPIGAVTWNSASLGLTNLFVTEQSGAIFAGKHRVLIGAEDGLSYRLPNGNLSDFLANPLQRGIEERGGTVILGAQASEVEPLDAPRGLHQVRVAWMKDGFTVEKKAHYVVLALQPWDARRVVTWMTAPWMTLERVTPVITMTLGLSGRVQASPDGREYGFSREQWYFSVVTDLSRFWPEFQGEKTVLRVEIGHADLLPHTLDNDDDELVRIVKRDLERFWPEIRGMTVEFAKLHREEKHLYVSWTQGQWQKKPKPAERLVSPHVFLAGDWTTRGTIGMEAAVNSAYEAANWILAEEQLETLPYTDVPLG